MQSWGVTHAGCVRPQNQDAYQIESLDEDTVLCVVCDGMGGARSGNVASALAADALVGVIRASWKPSMTEENVKAMFRDAVKSVNFIVFEQASEVTDFAGMGTTLVAALVHGRMATVVNVGDSRAYLVEAEGIRTVTQDHSVVQMMVDRGELTPQQAKSYPGKNFITRAIGTDPSVECDVFQLEMKEDDSLLLCTDGLSNLLDDQEILFEVVYGGPRADCCRRLLEIAINRGAPDNVTCLLLQV